MRGRMLIYRITFGESSCGRVHLRCNSAVIRLQNLYVQRIPKSGRTPDEVLDYLGLDSKAIARAVKG